MKVRIHSIHFDADQKLISFVQQKLDRLEKYFQRVVDAEVILRLNNSSPDNKTVEIILNIPKNQLFAKERSNTFESAIDIAIDVIKRNLLRHKDKLVTH